MKFHSMFLGKLTFVILQGLIDTGRLILWFEDPAEKPTNTMHTVKQVFFIAAPGTRGISPPNVCAKHPVISG